MWPETGLEWIPPSPNLPSFEHVFAYVGTVIIEGTNLSEGRGTRESLFTDWVPNFERSSTSALQKSCSKSIMFNLIPFHSLQNQFQEWLSNPKWEGQTCHGVRKFLLMEIMLKPIH
ncbi:hypothetical protein [Rhodohalobacter sp.]|uniref:hypothetical protein n=1 Tax=Rhodohalobacter sp. TaxID=1974210 RepID=UPI003A10309B